MARQDFNTNFNGSETHKRMMANRERTQKAAAARKAKIQAERRAIARAIWEASDDPENVREHNRKFHGAS